MDQNGIITYCLWLIDQGYDKTKLPSIPKTMKWSPAGSQSRLQLKPN